MALVLVAALGASCSNSQVQEMQAPEMKAVKIEPQKVTETLEYAAQIRGKHDVAIYPQVTGTITSIKVKEGQLVQKGQVLFVINQVPFMAEYETAKANLDAAKAQVATSELTYENYKILYERNVVSKYQMMVSYNQMLTAKAQAAQASAKLTSAKEDLSFTEVRSPVTGLVGVLPFKEGALVSPQIPEPLTTVSDNSEVEAYVSISEYLYLRMVREMGNPVQNESKRNKGAEFRLKLKDNSIYELTGKVSSISGVIDPGTGSLNVKVLFENKDRMLISGGTAKLLMTYDEDNCIVLPKTAVKELQDKHFVYKVVDGKTIMTEVEVVRMNGESSSRNYLVTSGLAASDVVIVEGVGKLSDAMSVVPVLN